MTRQSSFKQSRKKQTKIKFSSEPVKLNNSSSNSSNNSSYQSNNNNNNCVKRGANSTSNHKLNYLKNLNTFEQHIEIESLQLLVKKLENVTNLSTLLKSITKPATSASSTSKTYSDVAIQTSLTLIATTTTTTTATCEDSSFQSASFNSHGTATIMQTNCFGSIVGNFGSAMIPPYQNTINNHNNNNNKFTRSHSDDYNLSTDDTEITPMLSSTSAKLTKLRLMKT